MFDDATLAQRHNAPAADDDAELLALIAEWRAVMQRGDDLYDESERRTEEISKKTPPRRIEIGRVLFKDGSEFLIETAREEDITDNFIFQEVLNGAFERAHTQVELKSIPPCLGARRDELIAELRARRAAWESAREAAGVEAL